MISLDPATTLERCLLCGDRNVHKRVALRPMPIATPNFAVPRARAGDAALTAGTALDLWQCGACGHVQVGELGDPELQYREYIYTTSLSTGLAEHFARYGAAVIERYGLRRDDLVVELGSNDGTLLRVFAEAGMRVHGVDPAVRIAHEATQRGIPTSPEFFGSLLADQLRDDNGPARAIIANNMIANVRDLGDFVQGVGALLAPDGVFIFETQYGPDVIDGVLLDTVYHEHISYFFAAPTAAWLLRNGLEAIDFEHIATKGGSIRVVAQLRGGPRTPSPVVQEWIAREHAQAVFEGPFFDRLTAALGGIRADLGALVAEVRASGKKLAGYGVSVGTVALIPQFDVAADLAFLVDDDPHKAPVLHGPDYALPVLRPAALLEQMPGAVIIFAWRYADAIVAKNREYVERGGEFIVPLPAVRRNHAQKVQ
jgi:SAM-dependent methyltransferase